MNLLPFGIPTLIILITLWVIVERWYYKRYVDRERLCSHPSNLRLGGPPPTVGEVNPKWYKSKGNRG